jgi:CPA2 family monovalent cation:H+ antiporter-2
MLTIIVTTLAIALVLNIILKRFHLPTIIGYIFTGTIIAYGFGLHDAVHNHDLKEIAEFGVVFLMFTIGLEFSIEHLKRMRYEVFVAGTMQIVLSTSAVFIIAFYIIGLEQNVSFIIALSIALSSTAIVLKTLNETGEINKRFGQRSLGILIMQDIAVIPILLIIGFMSNNGGQEVGYVLLEMFGSAIILLGILYLFGKFVLERFFETVLKTDSDELFIMTILFLAIGSSYLAHFLGFSYSLGAFIAGMLIAETKYKYQAEADLIPFRDILLGIFFITVGMQINFDVIFEYAHYIVILLIGVFILKFIIIYGITRLNESKKVSFKTALALVQIGEFSLALLELARSNDLIGAPYGQIMIITIVISMIATPIILKNLTRAADKVIKNLDEDTPIISSNYSDHTIILGFGELGQSLAEKFDILNLNYVAVENNIDKYHQIKDKYKNLVFANGAKIDILKTLGCKKAKNIIVTIDNPQKLHHICCALLNIIPKEKIFVKVHSKFEAAHLRELGIKHIIIENEISSRVILDNLFTD